MTKLVLVVEDDRDVRETLMESLRGAGYEVLGAGNGLQALERLREAARLPDALLLDLMMPRMNGAELRAELLHTPAWASIPIVVLTAAAEAGELGAFLGAVAALRKPVRLAELLEAVRRACG